MLGIALVPLAGCAAFVGRYVYGDISPSTVSFISNIVFLNTLHVAFSFVILFYVPEVRTWLLSGRRASRVPLPMGIAAVSLSAFLIIILVLIHPEPPSVKFSLYKLLIIGLAAVPPFHTGWQMKGLAALYTRTAWPESSPVEQELLRTHSKVERTGFSALVALWILHRILVIFNEPLPLPISIKAGFALGFTFTSALLVWNSWRLRGIFGNSKTLFLFRLFIFIPMPFDTFSNTAFQILHGVEYYFIFQRMMGENRSATGMRLTSAIGLLLVGVLSIPVVFRFTSQTTGTPPLFIALIAAASLAISYTHYYVDRILFLYCAKETGFWNRLKA